MHETTGKVETHIDFRSELNPQQYDVVTASEGPSLVLAGAGSGKTRTLIYRLAWLLEKGIPPQNIVLMTFTNKAARQMRDRAEMLLGYKPKRLWCGTFHHIGNRTLRMYADELGYGKDFAILDQHDSRELIKSCVKKLNIKTKEVKFPRTSIIGSIISFAANTQSTTDQVLQRKYPYFLKFSEEMDEIKKNYCEKKRLSNSMDYDDLLVNWKILLQTKKHVKQRFNEQFRYIMVDEYQDTNCIQAEIIDLLSEAHGNVLVVGDDAQSIYSFRGAQVQNILNFPKRFTKAKIFKLETNYRSTPEILELANDSLENNLVQFEKHLRAVNPSFEKPVLAEVKNAYSQASFIAQRVLELREEGIPMDKMGVLFRAHYQAAELEMELIKRDIPYIVRGGIRFFEQAHIKDIISFLRLTANPKDEVAWLRTLGLCPGIGPGYADKIYQSFNKGGRDLVAFVRSENLSSVVPARARSGYVFFQKIMREVADPELSKMPSEMIEAALESGYSEHILSSFENAKDRIDDIRELINFASGYSNTSSFLNDITLRESFKGESLGGSYPQDDEMLVLSTIHQAKGLEWDALFVIGLCEGQFPHAKSFDEDGQLEEERRLFYVAVTRAKKHLYMLHPMMRYDYQMGSVIARRSRFLEELAEEDYELWRVDDYDDFEGRGLDSGKVIDI